jgi:nitroreductase
MSPIVDNNTLKTIRQRHSVRQFRDDPVDEDTLFTVLDAANRAPSAHNQQSWRFIIIRGQKKSELTSLVSRRSGDFHKPVSTILRMASRTIASAPVVVAVMSTGQIIENGDQLFRVDKSEALDFFRTLEIQSSSAAVENLLLAARSLGLGSVWLGILLVLKEEILDFLQESHGEFMAVVPLGYPRKPMEGPRKKSLDNVVKEL